MSWGMNVRQTNDNGVLSVIIGLPDVHSPTHFYSSFTSKNITS